MNKGLFVLIPLAVVVVGIWMCPVLNIPPVVNIAPNGIVQERTQMFYLLSTIAQSLSAILALVFTISLIIIQMFSRYSYRISSGFSDRITISYISLFIIAVFLPFWVLAQPTIYGAKASLTLAAVCLFLLVPYFIHFGRKLNPEQILVALKKSAVKQLNTNIKEEPETIATIDNMIMSAFALKDYDTFNRGIRVFREINHEVINTKNYDVIDGEMQSHFLNNRQARLEDKDVGCTILQRLSDIGVATIEDPRAPFHVVTYLGDIGKEATSKQLVHISELVVEYLEEIGRKAANKELEHVDKVIDCLCDIGKMAGEGEGRILVVERKAVRALAMIGHVIATKRSGLGWSVVNSIGNIGIKTAERSLLTGTLDSAIMDMANLGVHFAGEGNGYTAGESAELIHKMVMIANERGVESTIREYAKLFKLPLARSRASASKRLDGTMSKAIYYMCTIAEKCVDNKIDYPTRQMVDFLSNFALISFDKGLEDSITMAPLAIRDIGIKAAENIQKPVMYDVFKHLVNIEIKAVELGNDDMASKIAAKLAEVNLKCIENGIFDVPINAADQIMKIGMDAAGKGTSNIVQEAAILLCIFGACAIAKGNTALRERIIVNLQGIQDTADAKLISLALSKAQGALQYLPDVGKALKTFDTYYRKNR
ncbi:MAG: hypothetical protein WCD72_01400 [Dehalococcoidia bacterium]